MGSGNKKNRNRPPGLNLPAPEASDGTTRTPNQSSPRPAELLLSPPTLRPDRNSPATSPLPSPIPTVAEDQKEAKGDQARFAKKLDEHNAAEKDLYDKWGEAQKRSEEFEQKWKAAEEEKQRLQEQVRSHGVEVKNHGTQLNDLKAQLEQKDREHEQRFGRVADLQQTNRQLQDELENALSAETDAVNERKATREQKDELAAQVSGLTELLQQAEGTHEAVQTLEVERDAAHEELHKIVQTFEETFTELSSGLSLDEYLKHLRETVQTRRLRRDESQTSLHSDTFGEPHRSRPSARGNRQVSSASVSDELQGFESGDEQEHTDGEEEAALEGEYETDVTLKDIKVGPDDPFTNAWIPGDVSHHDKDQLFGETLSAKTQTPTDGYNQDPFPHQPTHVEDADTYDGGNRSTQTDASMFPTETVAEIQNLRQRLSNAEHLCAKRQKEKEAQFQLAFSSGQDVKKLVAERTKLSGEIGELQVEVGKYRDPTTSQIAQADDRIVELENALREMGRGQQPQRPATQDLSISTIQEIASTLPGSAPVSPPATPTLLAPVFSALDIFKALPLWQQLLITCLVGVLARLFYDLEVERQMWEGANDLIHQQLVMRTSGSRVSMPGVLRMMVGEYLGADMSLMG